ncbi:MAG TPA: histidine triad nucleotide-binding protein [Chloroflexi bacterium]|nr:histidine triad nucleotide-binding protein [Chloroflexota bacterium]
MRKQDCVFCRIVRGEAPAQIIYQDEQVTAFRDLNPQSPTHVLIVPNRHISGVAEVDQEDAAVLGQLFVVARRVAEQEHVADGFRLVVNNGRPAGQSVFHLHVHLLGGRAMGWPPG